MDSRLLPCLAFVRCAAIRYVTPSVFFIMSIRVISFVSLRFWAPCRNPSPSPNPSAAPPVTFWQNAWYLVKLCFWQQSFACATNHKMPAQHARQDQASKASKQASNQSALFSHVCQHTTPPPEAIMGADSRRPAMLPEYPRCASSAS